MAEPPVERRVQLAPQLLALAAISGEIGLNDAVRWVSGLVVAGRYPNDPDLMTLYGLSDEWGKGWGRPQAAPEEEAKEGFDRLAAGAPAPAFLVCAVARSR